MSPPKVPLQSLLLLPAWKRRPFALKPWGCTLAYLLLGRIISLFQKPCQHVHKVVSRNYRSPEHRWLCLISHWLTFTHAKKWCLSSFRFSVCSWMPTLVCLCAYDFVLVARTLALHYTHQTAHRVLSILLARLPNNKPNPLCLSGGSTHCSIVCEWHTSPIAMIDLNASWHQHSPQTMYLLMQDTVGCLQTLVEGILAASPRDFIWLMIINPPKCSEPGYA